MGFILACHFSNISRRPKMFSCSWCCQPADNNWRSALCYSCIRPGFMCYSCMRRFLTNGHGRCSLQEMWLCDSSYLCQYCYLHRKMVICKDCKHRMPIDCGCFTCETHDTVNRICQECLVLKRLLSPQLLRPEDD